MGTSILPKHNKVSSVNGEIGDVIVNRVSLADNLYSPDNNEIFDDYIFRTSGGSVDINSGDADLLFINGNMVADGRVPASANISSSGDLIPSVSISTFQDSPLGSNSGTYTFTCVSYWTYNNNPINLSDYGISISNPGDNNNTIIIEYDKDNVTATAAVNGNFSASVDADSFLNSPLGSNSGTYTFTCVSYWTYNNNPINLSDYGISISNPGDDDDTITVIYSALIRGTLIVATPSRFKSIGLNQFDKVNNIISGYTINANGNIVSSPGSYVGYAHVVGGLDDGYTAYSSNSAITRVAYSPDIPQAGDTGLEVLADDAESNNGLQVPYDGYLCVATSDINTLCIHPTWSGKENTTYKEYSEDFLDIPTVDKYDNPLPTATYGMPRIGTVFDTLSFATLTYIKRIGYYAYSSSNLETVKQLGVDYDYDANNIFYVLPNAETYFLDSNVIGKYIVDDYGTEEFLGTDVPLSAQNLYGSNLRDKLRRIYLDYKIYDSVADLEMTVGTATIQEAVSKLPLNSILISPSEEWASTELPAAYGCVEIGKQNTNTRAWINFLGRRENDATYTMYMTSGAGAVPTGVWKKDLTDLDVNYKIYDSVADLGLTIGSATISGIWSALPNYSILICDTNDIDASERPNSSFEGVLTVIKNTGLWRGVVTANGRAKSYGDWRMHGNGNALRGVWVRDTGYIEYITSGTVDLNDYRTAGTYYFSGSVTINNVPNSAVNGWLTVIATDGLGVKQIWHRQGSNPTTFRDFFIRLYASSTWGDWIRVFTEKDLSSTTPVKDTASGSVGTGVTVARSDHAHPLNVDSTAPANLGSTASAGSAATYARRDHVHKYPTPDNIGAVAATATTGSFTPSATGHTFSNTVLREKNGIVFFQTTDAITASVGTSAVTIGTLPSGYRPSFAVRARFPGQNSGVVINMDISTAGVVQVARTPQPSGSDGTRIYVAFPKA